MTPNTPGESSQCPLNRGTCFTVGLMGNVVSVVILFKDTEQHLFKTSLIMFVWWRVLPDGDIQTCSTDAVCFSVSLSSRHHDDLMSAVCVSDSAHTVTKAALTLVVPLCSWSSTADVWPHTRWSWKESLSHIHTEEPVHPLHLQIKYFW